MARFSQRLQPAGSLSGPEFECGPYRWRGLLYRPLNGRQLYVYLARLVGKRQPKMSKAEEKALRLKVTICSQKPDVPSLVKGIIFSISITENSINHIILGLIGWNFCKFDFLTSNNYLRDDVLILRYEVAINKPVSSFNFIHNIVFFCLRCRTAPFMISGTHFITGICLTMCWFFMFRTILEGGKFADLVLEFPTESGGPGFKELHAHRMIQPQNSEVYSFARLMWETQFM